MELVGATFKGPALSEGLPSTLPAELRKLLGQVNGFIAFHGGLHLRGWCDAPAWHALEPVWTGALALCRLYVTVQPTDVPFAEDPLGNQFLLRDSEVHRLDAETGVVRGLGLGLLAFLSEARSHPVEVLTMGPLIHFQHEEGGVLRSGELLMAYPPLCTREARDGVELKPAPAEEVIRAHAELAKGFAAVAP